MLIHFLKKQCNLKNKSLNPYFQFKMVAVSMAYSFFSFKEKYPNFLILRYFYHFFIIQFFLHIIFFLILHFQIFIFYHFLYSAFQKQIALYFLLFFHIIVNLIFPLYSTYLFSLNKINSFTVQKII